MTRTIEHRPLRARLAPWYGWLLLALAWLLPPTSGAEGPVTEEVAKALALSKIGDYVKWPPGTFPDARSPVVIGVIGRNYFEAELEQILKNTSENAAGRKVIVRQFKDGEPVENCQMLFVAASEKSRMSQILKKLEGTGILTISDLDGFVTRYGGCLGLFVKGKALQLDVNLTAAGREQITFSIDLLSLKGTRRIRDGKEVK